MIKSLLMVCTGNICRSPLAEFQMRHIAPEFKVSSAGIAAVEGAGIDISTAEIAREDGLDVSGHVARQISDDVIFGHDLIIVMDRGQYDWVVHNFPQDRGRVVMLTRWSGGGNIPDPFRRSMAVHRLVHKKIVQCCHEWRRHLLTSTTTDNND